MRNEWLTDCRLWVWGNTGTVFSVTTHPSVLDHPLKWKKPSLVFVNSMSDLFHEQVEEDFIKRVFDTMNRAHHHTFQVLTKRPERVIEMDKFLALDSEYLDGCEY